MAINKLFLGEGYKPANKVIMDFVYQSLNQFRFVKENLPPEEAKPNKLWAIKNVKS